MRMQFITKKVEVELLKELRTQGVEKHSGPARFRWNRRILTWSTFCSEVKRNTTWLFCTEKKWIFIDAEKYALCFSSDSWGEGVKSNKAILRRGVFDQRFSKQAAGPRWAQDLYAPTCAILTSRLLPLLKQSCRIGNSWSISNSAPGKILLSKKCWDTPCAGNIFAKSIRSLADLC